MVRKFEFATFISQTNRCSPIDEKGRLVKTLPIRYLLPECSLTRVCRFLDVDPIHRCVQEAQLISYIREERISEGSLSL